ncbi:MAG: HAMP domain-containing histidine kinase [Planctomycetes bacterium]|nr:HAMP domain-containing histidine kinase [Planctomycetota bacterium]
MKPWRIWLVFAICVTLVGGAMGFVTLKLLRLDRDQAQTRERARLEELARLALYRMDSLLFPILAVESKRPYFEYSATYAPDRAYGNLFRAARESEREVPSPLLQIQPMYLRLHFQVHQDGAITSPQVPEPEKREVFVERGVIDAGRVEACAARLSELERVLKSDPRWNTLFETHRPDPAAAAPKPPTSAQDVASASADDADFAQNLVEFQNRQQARAEMQRNASKLDPSSATSQIAGAPAVVLDEFQPAWIGRELLLVRRVRVGGATYVQGCWLDWEAIRTDLLSRIRDLLPNAKLVPLQKASRANPEHQLAALPAALVPGRIARSEAPPATPLFFSLSLAIGSALVAAVAVALLLFVMISFNERRAAFVSTVTHELRTPLTSLRLMSDLLLQARADDPVKRKRYLETLQREAARLSHLVENVLAYSRLEADRSERRRETLRLDALLERTLERCRERAGRGGMELDVRIEPELLARSVRADPAAVEQILFNLVDNACKYAGDAHERRIELSGRAEAAAIALRVRDFGPGVDAAQHARLFHAFQRAKDGEVRGVPGVGLGLALSRRLARAMGGELRHDDEVDRGAAFLLRLPTA